MGGGGTDILPRNLHQTTSSPNLKMTSINESKEPKEPKEPKESKEAWTDTTQQKFERYARD